LLVPLLSFVSAEGDPRSPPVPPRAKVPRKLLDISLEDRLLGGRTLHRPIASPIPEDVILTGKQTVVFLPRFLGTLAS
jgi:hypothetical protein